MRHVYMRGIFAFIWLAAAMVCGVSGNPEMAIFYIVIGGVFLYSAYSAWKKEKNGRGEK